MVASLKLVRFNGEMRSDTYRRISALRRHGENTTQFYYINGCNPFIRSDILDHLRVLGSAHLYLILLLKQLTSGGFLGLTCSRRHIPNFTLSVHCAEKYLH